MVTEYQLSRAVLGRSGGEICRIFIVDEDGTATRLPVSAMGFAADDLGYDWGYGDTSGAYCTAHSILTHYLRAKRPKSLIDPARPTMGLVKVGECSHWLAKKFAAEVIGRLREKGATIRVEQIDGWFKRFEDPQEHAPGIPG